jgi:hypothetical protein
MVMISQFLICQLSKHCMRYKEIEDLNTKLMTSQMETQKCKSDY